MTSINATTLRIGRIVVMGIATIGLSGLTACDFGDGDPEPKSGAEDRAAQSTVERNCLTGCSKAGASAADCKIRCAQERKACYDGCAKAGGTPAQCKVRCERRRTGKEMSREACLKGCKDAGGSADQCKKRCPERETGAKPSPEECLKECSSAGVPADKCKIRCTGDPAANKDGAGKPR